eukprot:g13674.t1 g13674   contig9:178697-179467(+)
MDKMPSSPYFTSCQLEPISQVVDPDSESGATIFWDRSNGSTLPRQLVVACRGSANPKNFGTNLKFKLVPATRLSQNYLPENALVHEGFQDASVGLWKVLGPKLFEILETTMRDEAGGGETTITLSDDIVFTGHSLGAATALLCSVHYNASRNKQQPIPQITSFGGPKLCNGVLARYLRNEALAGCNVVHLVHDKDPVWQTIESCGIVWGLRMWVSSYNVIRRVQFYMLMREMCRSRRCLGALLGILLTIATTWGCL